MLFSETFRKWAVLLVTVEVGGFAVFYYVWHNMNTSQEYRRKMYINHRYVLDAFYHSCTIAGIHGVKERDLKDWKMIDNSKNTK